MCQRINMRRYMSTALIFVLILGVGFWIASKKPISNDEYYSTTKSIHEPNYIQMMAGKIPEGNNSPLYYVLQKILIDVAPYHVRSDWIAENWTDTSLLDRIVLRINPVLFMSLSIALIFYFFIKRINWKTALLSVFIYLSTYMLWSFWAEARPYALLVFLTTLQSILLVRVVETKGKKGVKSLTAVHVLLAFTSIFSLVLIVAATGALLWHRIKQSKILWLINLGAVALVMFYYSMAPKYTFYFDLTPEQMIRDNVSRERFYIFIAFILCWLFCAVKGMRSSIDAVIPYFKFCLMIFVMTVAILMIFKAGAKPDGRFPVSSRYFMYLMPIGVMASVWICCCLSTLIKHRIWQVAFWIGIMALCVPRFMKIATKGFMAYYGL